MKIKEKCTVSLLTARLITKQTIDAMNVLYEEVFPGANPYTSIANINHCFKNNIEFAIVRTKSGRIVGMAHLSFTASPRYYEIRHVCEVFISKDFRNKGLGKKIIETFIKESKIGANSRFITFSAKGLNGEVTSHILQRFGFQLQKATNLYYLALR